MKRLCAGNALPSLASRGLPVGVSLRKGIKPLTKLFFREESRVRARTYRYLVKDQYLKNMRDFVKYE